MISTIRLVFLDNTAHHHVSINDYEHHNKVPKCATNPILISLSPLTLSSPDAFVKLIFTFD
jgi:hypothetical protein